MLRSTTLLLLMTGYVACAGNRTEKPLPTDPAMIPWDLGAAATQAYVERIMLDELATMRTQWSQREARAHYRAPLTFFSSTLIDRTLRMHCHIGRGSSPLGEIRMPDGQSLQISEDSLPFQFISRRVRHALCPGWLPVTDSGSHDGATRERFSADVATLLVSAHERFPERSFFARQMVRVLLGRGEALRADSLLGQCQSEAWCLTLKGLVHHELQRWRSADSLFRQALEHSPLAVTCGWTANSELVLAPRDWKIDRRCVGDAVDSTRWWLAKPFWLEDVNYRWLAHVVRHIEWSVRAELSQDLFWDINEQVGGDIVRQLHLRYGAPVHVFNAGPEQDRSHRRYLQGASRSLIPEPPYSAPEYDRRAQALFPTSNAVIAIAPLSLSNADYALDRPSTVEWKDWWPSEIFRHPRGTILTIPAVQHALLRRNGHALVVAGLQLSALANDSVSAATVWLLGQSPGGALQALDRQEAIQWGARTVLTGALDRPTVLSLEALGTTPGVAGARYRWGVPVVPMTPTAGTCALSDPLLLEGAVTGTDFDAVRQRVRSSTTLPLGSTTGLYWESYGFLPGDSADVQVVVESTERSAVSALEQERVVSIAWREPSAATALVPVDQHPTTLGRVMTLNVAALQKGSYQLRITMRSARCAQVSGTRAFQVQ